MPWKSLNSWLYDGSRKSPVPEILLKSGSPITHQTLLKMFINHGPLNHYLNKYMNTVWIFKIDKEEILKFIKKCVLDYKIRKGSAFFSRRQAQDKLFDILRDKIPTFKNDDLALLSTIISKSKNRDEIYESLGMKTTKMKKSKKVKPKKISQKVYINENFNIIEVK